MTTKSMMSGLVLLLAMAGCHAEATVGPPPPPPPPPAPLPPPPPPAPAPEYITINDRIEFETGNAVLLPQSFPVLDQVVKILTDRPYIQLVEIQGHTDDTGDQGRNLLLSEQRAQSVRVYLISKGIAAERLRVRGFGARVPVADNNSPAGREKNRRVEFRIVTQAAPATG